MNQSIAQIHPLNTEYLLKTQPHRFYADIGGNTLEIIVARFASTVAEKLYGHGGIIGVGYHDATTDGLQSFQNMFLLSQKGEINALHSQYGEPPIGIDIDIFYMLLNPVEINNWILQDRQAVEKERISLGRGVGMDGSSIETNSLKNKIATIRDQYFQNIR